MLESVSGTDNAEQWG